MDNNKTIPGTLGEAIELGYELGGQTYQRGYISRRIDQDRAPVHIAGGSRAGELYVLLPSWDTTLYCVRQYLINPADVLDRARYELRSLDNSTAMYYRGWDHERIRAERERLEELINKLETLIEE